MGKIKLGLTTVAENKSSFLRFRIFGCVKGNAHRAAAFGPQSSIPGLSVGCIKRSEMAMMIVVVILWCMVWYVYEYPLVWYVECTRTEYYCMIVCRARSPNWFDNTPGLTCACAVASRCR